MYSDTFIEFAHPYTSPDFSAYDNKYVEADHEDPDFYVMFYQEFYSLCNCRFSFDIFGGYQTLDDSDFIDVNLYLDRRNLKHVYNNINFKYTNIDYSKLYSKAYNYNNRSKLDLFNIELNSMLKDDVKEDKRRRYLRVIKDNNQITNEKNI